MELYRTQSTDARIFIEGWRWAIDWSYPDTGKAKQCSTALVWRLQLRIYLAMLGFGFGTDFPSVAIGASKIEFNLGNFDSRK